MRVCCCRGGLPLSTNLLTIALVSITSSSVSSTGLASSQEEYCRASVAIITRRNGRASISTVDQFTALESLPPQPTTIGQWPKEQLFCSLLIAFCAASDRRAFHSGRLRATTETETLTLAAAAHGRRQVEEALARLFAEAAQLCAPMAMTQCERERASERVVAMRRPAQRGERGALFALHSIALLLRPTIASN